MYCVFFLILVSGVYSFTQIAFSSCANKPDGGIGVYCNSIATSLGNQLSQAASISLPNGTQYASLEIRASSPRISPAFTAIVEVATAEDVEQTVKYANACDLPFLAVGGGHGWQSTINNANGGIQINMRKLQHIRLERDGSVVAVGGGVKQRHLTQTLYSLGKQAVTGLCECTSVIGPLMGGGHSALQGFHGYSSDNILSAQVVLANGSSVTASTAENPDLFWALRGAGHNFGIVTSFTLKAYKLPKTQWTVVSVVYTQDKLEDFIDALNEVDNGGDHVPELVLAGAITRIPTVDTKYPVVAYQLSYLGTPDEVEPYVARFRQAGPVSVSVAEKVAYKDYYVATNSAYNQTTCQKDNNISGYTVSLSRYNTTAMRTAFKIFSDLTADGRYASSVWLLESYGSRGVWTADRNATSVSPEERELSVLTVPITWWAGDSAEAREKAEVYGKLMRATLAAGDQETSESAHIYLNYAMGGESLEQMYGAGPLPRLQDLKRKYDPTNRFGYYMPLM